VPGITDPVEEENDDVAVPEVVELDEEEVVVADIASPPVMAVEDW